MNNVVLIGRITKDPDIRYSNSGVTFGSYTLAVDRPVKSDYDSVTDFIYCKVVGKTADFAEKYLTKGVKIAVTGRLQVDNYTDKDGNKRSQTYIQVQSHEFCEKKYAPEPAPTPKTDSDGFMHIPDGIDDDLPFN